MKEFKITEKEAGQRLDKYLKRLLPAAEPSLLYRMLRKKNILLNGKKAEGKERIETGDRVRLYFSDESFEKLSKAKETRTEGTLSDFPPELAVLYETEDIVLINKPAGVLSQKAKEEDQSVNEWLRLKYRESSGYRPSVLNRLDRNTSGLVLAAKTLKGARDGSLWLREGSLKKRYECIVAGTPEKEAEGAAYLYKDHAANTVKIYEKPVPGKAEAQEIRFRYERMKTMGRYALLSVDLLTGKSHQIRAHLSWSALPILGDPKYGDQKENLLWKQKTGLNRQLLHAKEVLLPTGESVIAPYPRDFSAVMEALEG